MKKINVIFPVLIAAVCLIGLGTGCTAKAKKAYHEKRAEKFFAAGQFDRAEIEYLNVLRNDNENVRAFAQLGNIYYDDGRFQRAAFFLAKASSLATNDLELRLKLGFINSTGGKFQEARDQALFILERNPQDPEAPLLLAESVARPADAEVARKKIQALIQARDSAPLQVALGNIYFRQREMAKATAAYQRAQALDPRLSALNVALGALSWEQNDLVKAEAFFKQAADASPIRSPRRMQYVRFKIQTGGATAVRPLLEEMLKSSPDYLPALLALAEVSARENKLAECSQLLTKALARDDANFEAMLFYGQLKQTQGEFSEAVAAFERLLRVYPQSPQGNYHLALACFASEDMSKGMAALSRALELVPDYPEAIILQAQMFLRSGNVSPVVVALEKLRQKQPQLEAAQMLLADAYRLQDRLRDALAIYQALEKSNPTNAQLPLLQGAAYLQLKDGVAARQAFNRALTIAPGNLPAIEQLVNADLAEQNFAAAQQRVQAELATRPKQIELHFMQAKIQSMQGNTNAAEATLIHAAELEPQNPTAYLLLAQMYVDAKQNQKALVKLEQAIACSPKNIPAMMLLALIYTNEKEYAKAAGVYDKVLAVDPKFSPAINNLAYLCSEFLNELDRAYDLAQDARKLLPFDPYTADTLGWVAFRRGDYATAVGLLKESAEKLPQETEILGHYGLAAYMSADEEIARTALTAALKSGGSFAGQDACRQALSILDIDARTAAPNVRDILEKRVADKPDDVLAWERLAIILERDGQTAKAIRAYEKVINVAPRNFESTLHLARLYAATDAKRAYELAKTAYKLSPYDPDVLQLLAGLSADLGDYKLAASFYQETLKKRTDDAGLYLGLARSAFAIGKVSEAQTALAGAQKLTLPAPVAAEVKRMGQFLILVATPSAATPADETAVNEALKADPNYLPALAAQAALLEKAGDTKTAAAKQQKILTLYPDFAPAQKQLALLYAKDSTQVTQAYDLALKAREAYPNDLSLTKAIGIILVQKADYPRAVSLLKQCASALPNDPEVFFYLGSAQFQLKNAADSKANLQRALTLKLNGPNATAAQQMLSTLK